MTVGSGSTLPMFLMSAGELAPASQSLHQGGVWSPWQPSPDRQEEGYGATQQQTHSAQGGL